VILLTFISCFIFGYSLGLKLTLHLHVIGLKLTQSCIFTHWLKTYISTYLGLKIDNIALSVFLTFGFGLKKNNFLHCISHIWIWLLKLKIL
jgi:hypothetical protein